MTPRRSTCSRKVSSASTRAVRACADAGIYSVIDLHAVPGRQNQHWHSDNPTHVAAFWQHPHFQDRVVASLAGARRALPRRAVGRGLQPAQRAGRPERRGRRPVPRPARGRGARGRPRPHRLRRRQHLLDRLQRVRRAVRRTRSSPATTTRRAGMALGGPYPGETAGQWVDRDTLEDDVPASAPRSMRETGTPIWVGEFGPVYTGEPERDEQRYQILSDQLDIYDAPRRRLVALDLQGRRPAGPRPHVARQRPTCGASAT